MIHTYIHKLSLNQMIRFVMMELNHLGLNLRFNVDVAYL
jgi:hypothetical protein